MIDQPGPPSVTASAGRGSCTVVVGCQWGDEGKGKIVDVLAREAKIVARYQGGANAGHTVHAGGREFILHQIPSGVLHPGVRCLLGNGVVLDAKQFLSEYDELAERGVPVAGRVGVSARAHVVFRHHRALDRATEVAAGRAADGSEIGTTGRGIGPAYEDKTGRRGVRVADLLEDGAEGAVARSLDRARARLAELGADPAEAGGVEEATALAERLGNVVAEVGQEIDDALAAGESVLLEGAQGTALDVDHGTYPYVTSSSTTAGSAAAGVGIGPIRIGAVTGVAKAYTTRVGNGPLPTEFPQAMDDRMRQLGGEFGATTGRPRRCGWFDGVVAAYARRVNGLTGIAVTKLDVLDTLPELKIATAYRVGTRVHRTTLPATVGALAAAQPVYETLPGWQSPTGSARRWRDLPPRAQAYLDRIQEVAGAPLVMVSVGTRRSQVIRLA